VDVSQSFNTSDAVTLYHQFEANYSLAEREPHGIKRIIAGFNKHLRTDFAAKALNAFFVLTKLFALSRTVMTRHCEPCLSLAIGSQSSYLGRLRAIALVLVKALLAATNRAFIFLNYQSPNYNLYITTGNSSCQGKSYLTYIIFSVIPFVWLNQRHGIGRCINARGVRISGYPVRRQIIRMFAPSAKALIGTSRAGTRPLNKLRAKNSSATGNAFVYNIEAHGRWSATHEATGLSPLLLWRNLDGDLELSKPDRDYHESPRVANVISQGWLPPFSTRWPGVGAPGFPLCSGTLREGANPLFRL